MTIKRNGVRNLASLLALGILSGVLAFEVAANPAGDAGQVSCPTDDLVMEVDSFIGPDLQQGGPETPEKALAAFIESNEGIRGIDASKFKRVKNTDARATLAREERGPREAEATIVYSGDSWIVEEFIACQSMVEDDQGDDDQ